MVNKEVSNDLSVNFRVYHGKLFAALINQFGAHHIDDIEDVIQNTLLKAMKAWKTDETPQKRESWLFIVARNEMLNLIKSRNSKESIHKEAVEPVSQATAVEDLRFRTIQFIVSQNHLSKKAKVLITLKHVFGLNTMEISQATLTKEEAINKLVTRTKTSLASQHYSGNLEEIEIELSSDDIHVIEEILYGLFTIGFDSFDTKKNKIVNEDLCLEALSIAKLLQDTYSLDSTSNLVALFCFHLARIPAKVQNGQLVSFIKQNRELWNKELIASAYHFLRKPSELDVYYLEALIISKHMASNLLDQNHWRDVTRFYRYWNALTPSKLIELNLAYCLLMAGENEAAIETIQALEDQFPHDHLYYKLIRAELVKDENPNLYKSMIEAAIEGLDHELRQSYLAKMLSNSQDQ